MEEIKMADEMRRATGLLVIEVVNSNPNGDPDREADPDVYKRQLYKEAGR